MDPEFKALDDDALRLRAGAGCRQALSELLERCAFAAIRAAHAVLGNREDALDAAQEAFLKAACELRTPSEAWRGGQVKAWVAVIAQRIALNRLKESQMRRRREERAGQPRAIAQDPPPDVALELTDALDALRSELANLPELSADVILLYHIHELPLAEVARQTGLSVDACKQRLSRGRDALSERLRKRGISIACLALLAGLSTSTRTYAGDMAPSVAAQWAGTAVSHAHRLNGKAPALQRMHPLNAVVVAILAFIGLAALMLPYVVRAVRTAESGSGQSVVLFQPSHSTQENSQMKSTLGKYVRAGVLAASALTSAALPQDVTPATAEKPAPKTASPIAPSAPSARIRVYSSVALSDHIPANDQIPVPVNDREIRINLDDVITKLKSAAPEVVATIPGDDLEAKAKHILENPSIPKKAVAFETTMLELDTGASAPDQAKPDARATETAQNIPEIQKVHWRARIVNLTVPIDVEDAGGAVFWRGPQIGLNGLNVTQIDKGVPGATSEFHVQRNSAADFLPDYWPSLMWLKPTPVKTSRVHISETQIPLIESTPSMPMTVFENTDRMRVVEAPDRIEGKTYIYTDKTQHDPAAQNANTSESKDEDF